MSERVLFLVWVFALPGVAFAEEPTAVPDDAEFVADAAEPEVQDEAIAAAADAPADPALPRTMSGMSILGNEEAPKALVIVPWKSSELGADLELSDTLDDRARPVDREVFMRELRYYELRSGEQSRERLN
jgi:hypothetical protein